MHHAARSLALSLLASLAAPALGLACSYAPDGAEVPAFVPANGALHFQLRCHFDASFCQLPDNLELVDSQGNAVPGRIVLRYDSDRAGYFRPDAPFVKDETYTILNLPKPDAVDADDHLTFSANDAISLSVDAVELTPTLSASWVAAGEAFACGGYVLCDESVESYDIYLKRLSRPALSLKLSGLPWIWNSNAPRQHVLQTRFFDGETLLSETPFSDGDEGWFVFPKALASYCYEVTVRSLEDDSEKVFKDCVEHGDLVTNVTEDVPESDLVSQVSYCGQPEDSEARAFWCDVRRRCAATNPGLCPEVPEVCGAEPDEQPADELKLRHTRGGCSLHAEAARESGTLWLAMLGLSACFARHRRRAVR